MVFGAVFDENLRVEHIGALDETELAGMRGSKYVQSDATDAIQNAVSLLRRDIPVLFSGAPCQINGLLAALGNQKTDKLLTVDFVCHGRAVARCFCELYQGTGKGTRLPRDGLHIPRQTARVEEFFRRCDL